MRVASPAQMREADRRAIEGGVPSLRLMENAGAGAAGVARDLLGDSSTGKTVLVLCGKGNNGGDGFVVARLLREWGAEVRLFAIVDAGELAGDAAVNFRLATDRGLTLVTIETEDAVARLEPLLARADLLVDALFGTGFTGEVRGAARALIEAMNRSGTPILALDVPSGVNAETGAVEGAAVRATVTATFGAPKLGLVFYPGRSHAGRVRVFDIGIPEESLAGAGVRADLVDPDLACSYLPGRRPDAHKGDCGRVLVVGGSPGLTGAVVLASNAAARSGAGLVTAVVPASLQDVVATKLTEVMSRAVGETPARTLSARGAEEILAVATDVDAFAVGPGLSRDPETAEAARRLALELPVTTVLDADALNAFEGRAGLLARAVAPRILTPHPGEAARLLASEREEPSAGPLERAERLVALTGAVVVLKGAPTIVAGPGGSLAINTTGNAGLATGGTGDVLTGLIAGLVAQGCAPLAAARLGVHLHGLAGDLGAERLTMWGLVAGDVLALLPEAFYVLSEGGEEPTWIS